MRLTSKPLGLIVIAAVFGGIAFSTWMGWWQTESTRVPVKFSEGESSGSYNPADIRGSYTFGDVSELFDIPLSDLQQAFLLPDGDIAGIGVKELEEMYADAAASGTEIGTGSVRLFAAFYKGLPFETAEEYLPAPAVRILKELGNLSDVRLAYLENHVVSMEKLGVTPAGLDPESNTVTNPDTISTAVLEPQEHVENEDRVIKGKTTFRDVLDWGVPQEAIESVLGQSMPSPLLTIKDFCLDQGLEFGTIRDALQLEVEPVE